MATVTDKIARKAGLLERFQIARHYVGHDSCVIVAAKYAAASEVLSKPTLYPALQKVIHSHAALGVCLKDESTEPSFIHLQEVILDQVVSFVDHDDMARAMEAECSRPLDTSGSLPLWRLTVLNDSTVLFAFHHCIGDGKSGAAFHVALITALNDPSVPQDMPSKVIVPGGELVPPIEDLVNVSISYSKFASSLWGLVAPMSWQSGNPSWTGNPVVETPHLRNNCRIFYFTPEESSRLSDACRANKSTITSAFHALAASVIARLVTKEHGPQRFKTLPSSVPVSLREMSNTPSEAICNHVSGCSISSPTSQTKFSWAVAAQLSEEFRTQAPKSPEIIGVIRLLFRFRNEKEFFKGREGKKRNAAFEQSNIGKFPRANDPSEKWKITGVVFSQCDSVGGPAIKLNAAGDPEGGIGMSVNWGDGAVEDAFVESFISGFREGCDELVGPTETK